MFMETILFVKNVKEIAHVIMNYEEVCRNQKERKEAEKIRVAGLSEKELDKEFYDKIMKFFHS